MSTVEDEETEKLMEMLCRVAPVQATNMTARSVTIVWQSLDTSEASASGGPFPQIDASEFTYEIIVTESRHDVKHDSYRCQAVGVTNNLPIDKLKPSTDYSVRLRASLSERGLIGEPSRAIDFRTKSCQPDKPAAPRCSKKTKDSLTLTWKKPCDNGSSIIRYVLECAEQTTRNGEGQFRKIYDDLGDLYRVTKLTPSTTYKFRLCADNEFGRSPWSDVLIVQTGGAPPPQPQPPQLVEPAEASVIHLRWTKRPMDDTFTVQTDDPRNGHGYVPQTCTQECRASVTGLRPNDVYRFRLVASNADGDSRPSEPVELRTSVALPGAPGRPRIRDRPRPCSVRLMWEPSTNTGGDEILAYHAQLRHSAHSDWTEMYTGHECMCIVDNLQPGASYITRVAARNSAGIGEPSETQYIHMNAEPPGTCDTLEVVGKAKQTSVNLRWNEPSSSGGAEINEYELWWTDEGDQQPVNPVVKALTQREYQLTNLAPGRAYSCSVRACNSAGCGRWSMPVLMLHTAPAKTSAPIDLCATSTVTSTSVGLEWSPPLQVNGAGASEYKVYWTPAHNEATTDVAHFEHNFIVRTPSATVDKLVANTSYAFVVTAMNAVGESEPSNQLVCSTKPGVPDAPRRVTVEAVSTSTLRVRWQAPADNGQPLSAYAVHCVNDRLKCDEMLLSTDENSDDMTLDGLKPETPYRVRVRASNNIGHSAFSAVVMANTLPLPPPPPVLELVSTAHNCLKLRWTDVKPPTHDDESYTYTVEIPNKFGTFSPVYDGTSHSCKLPRLNEATMYDVRIRCISSHGGAGAWSDPPSVFTTTRTPPPPVKNAPRIQSLGEHSWQVEWTPLKNPMGVGDKLHYCLQIANANASPRHGATTQEDWSTVGDGVCMCHINIESHVGVRGRQSVVRSSRQDGAVAGKSARANRARFSEHRVQVCIATTHQS
jgi:hypothetical protein